MVEVQQGQQSLAAQVDPVIDNVISNATVEDTRQLLAVAKVLGVDTQSLRIAGEGSNLEQKITEAAERLKAQLEPSSPMTSQKLAALNAANDKLTELIAINEGRIAPNAETILQGFKKLDGGVIELTLPAGTTIQEAGKLLNAAAEEKGMIYPVFYEGDAEFWAKNEANADLQTQPGQAYQFMIPPSSVSKTREKQVRDHGEGAPLGAIAIAEACERLNTENNGTLFKNAAGNKVWVRGLAPDVVLYSSAKQGVLVFGSYVINGDDEVAFASSVSVRN